MIEETVASKMHQHLKPLTSKITEVQGWVGNVYRTQDGWWGCPARMDEPSQLFNRKSDAIAYVRDCAQR